MPQCSDAVQRREHACLLDMVPMRAALTVRVLPALPHFDEELAVIDAEEAVEPAVGLGRLAPHLKCHGQRGGDTVSEEARSERRGDMAARRRRHGQREWIHVESLSPH